MPFKAQHTPKIYETLKHIHYSAPPIRDVKDDHVKSQAG